MAASGKVGRDVNDVFATTAAPKNMLAERFGSAGKYSVIELETPAPAGLSSAKPQLEPGLKVKVIGRYGLGELVEKVEGTSSSWQVLFEDGVEAIVLADRISTDLKEPEVAAKADNRTLFERLKEQRDAKQDEWEHKHTFKNQMDHWRLDDEDAAFEGERVDRLRAEAEQQRAEADEDLMRYRAAMAVKTRRAEPEPSDLLAPVAAAVPPEQGERAAGKRKAALPTAPIGLRVKPVAKRAREGAAVAAPSSAATPTPPQARAQGQPNEGARAVACVLPGMAAYDDDDDDDSQ